MESLFPLTVPLLSGGRELQSDPKPEYSEPISLGKFSVQFSQHGLKRLVQEIRQRRFDDWEWFLLALKGDELSLTERNPTKLLALEHLADLWKKVGVIPYPHQIKTAERAINEMRGQAILADEVGLGKTIEAGLILKEYILRGLVRKCLILTPASLAWQWYSELYEKFNIIAGIQRTKWDWTYSDILIASLDTAKRAEHASIIHEIQYDMLIIDEAHKLRNSSTAAFKFVDRIQKKFCLMLTATPVQNDLKELYNLISLLKPGQLGSYRSFRAKFMQDKRTAKNPEELRTLLSQVLIRNKRGEGTVQFTKRIVHPIVVTLSPAEQDLYNEITAFIRAVARRVGTSSNLILPLITLQREVCSSFFAAGMTLQKMLEKQLPEANPVLVQLLERAVQIRHNSKCDILEQLMATFTDKVIIFTEYRATQDYIRYRLQQAGYTTVGFDGRLSRGKKEWIKQQFANQAQVMVSTETGGEGLNFQFCNTIVNFDLPWNPMRLEQRIGRVHRLGQTRDVHIYNLVTEHTIEEHIMYLLHKKINMFQEIIGELDAILLHLKLDRSFESELMRIFLENDEKEEIRRELDKFGERILQGKQQIRSPIMDLLEEG
ncbi:MAG: DEAD/DEAH box helicase [Firmicutes bacterium]|nr:DEAD/DEAH box helicase [Bacillota bacterium]